MPRWESLSCDLETLGALIAEAAHPTPFGWLTMFDL